MLLLLRYPSAFLGVGLGLFVGIIVHSLAQAATARAFGDRQAAAQGRLSPDPRRHFEPFGLIVMAISGIGWNKPVPLQEPRFRGGRTKYVLAILAGPFANLVLATLALVGLRLTGTVALLDPLYPGAAPPLLGFGETVLFWFSVVNALVAVLTLLPIPPLDGAKILWLYAPKTSGWQNARYQLEERNFGIGIVVLLSLPLFGGVGLLVRIVVAVASAFLAPIAIALGFTVGF